MGLVTIGYEGRQLDEFVAALLDRGVEIVFDVRENPASRKPGFSKRRLGEALAAACHRSCIAERLVADRPALRIESV